MSPKRGRPPASSIEEKIKEGMASNSHLKCNICKRIFPRPKSLRAHYNCHTGYAPHKCDYPGCNKAFKQSGHLRSHQFRHTGEKPFKCPTADCGERFVHANRHCSIHDPLKVIKLIRDGKQFIDVKEENLDENKRQWLKNYEDKNYNSRGAKRPSESNDSDEENIPVNNKRSSIDGYNSAESESPASSPVYKNEVSDAGSESTSPSPSLDEFAMAVANFLTENDKNKSNKNKKYNSRGAKRPSKNNDSGEENIPVNNKRHPIDGCNSAGSESPSSSPVYKNELSDAGSDSTSPPHSLYEYDAVVGARLLLQMMHRRSFHENPTI